MIIAFVMLLSFSWHNNVFTKKKITTLIYFTFDDFTKYLLAVY